MEPDPRELDALLIQDDPRRRLADFARALPMTLSAYAAMKRMAHHSRTTWFRRAWARYKTGIVERYCEKIVALAHWRLALLRPADTTFNAIVDDVAASLETIRICRSPRLTEALRAAYRRLNPLLIIRLLYLYQKLTACWLHGRIRPAQGQLWARSASQFLNSFPRRFHIWGLSREDFERAAVDLACLKTTAVPQAGDPFTGRCWRCRKEVVDGRLVLRCPCDPAYISKYHYEQLCGARFRLPKCPKCFAIWTGI